MNYFKDGKTVYSNTLKCEKQESQLFDNQLLSYKQAASYLGVSISYLRQLKAAGKINCVLVGSRAIRFKVASLDSFVNQREITNERSKL